MAIDVIPYTPNRRDEVVDLIRLCLGEKPGLLRNAAWWDWRHEHNPFGRSIVLLAEAAGQIVGVRALLRWQLRAGEELVEAVKPVDTVTHPEFRRRNIFTTLTQAAMENARREHVDVLFNTPNRNSLPGYLKMGWRPVARLPLVGRVLRPFSTAWRMMSRRSVPAATDDDGDFFYERPVAAAAALERIDAVTGLIERTERHAGLATPRTQGFLHWRYTSHPQATYYAETVFDREELVGLLFYRLKQRGGLREIQIDDVYCDLTRGGAVESLFRQFTRRLRADYVVAHASGDSSQYEILRRGGFRTVPRKRIDLAARNVDDSAKSQPIERRRWSLSLADIEGL